MNESTLISLRGFLPEMALGLTFILLGAAALVGSVFTWKRRELSLFWYGVFAVLYGIRMWLRSVPLAEIFDWNARELAHAGEAIRYWQIPPLFLFLTQIYGNGWRGSLRLMWMAGIGGAVIATFLAFGFAESLDTGIVFLVLGTAGFAVVLLHLFLSEYRRHREQRLLGAAFCLAFPLVLNTFLVERGAVPWTANLEHPGLFLVLGVVGYILVSRVQANRAQMLTVRYELATARQIQQSMLPEELPELPGLRVAARYLPMEEVAGDHYELHRLDDHTLGVLVTDVSGHGIAAAMVSAMCRVAFKSQHARWREPSALLEGLNESFTDTLAGKYLTGTYLTVDADAGRIVHAGGAHPPVLVWRADRGEVVELQSSGTMIGLFPMVNATDTISDVASGDRIIAYTDGADEAMSPEQEPFGIERLRQFVAARHELDADAFADALIATLREWIGPEAASRGFDDDLTLVVIDIH